MTSINAIPGRIQTFVINNSVLVHVFIWTVALFQQWQYIFYLETLQGNFCEMFTLHSFIFNPTLHSGRFDSFYISMSQSVYELKCQQILIVHNYKTFRYRNVYYFSLKISYGGLFAINLNRHVLHLQHCFRLSIY